MKISVGLSVGVFAALAGCAEKHTDGPAASSAAAPAPPLAAPARGATRLTVRADGTATFLIDAPLEKIQGKTSRTRGELDVDVGDLTKSRGDVDVDLDTLATTTFEDPDRNASQTEHAHNWMEIGSSVAAAAREQNRWARLTITGVDVTGPTKLSDVPEVDGKRTVHVVIHAGLALHGVTSQKAVRATATFAGSVEHPSVHVVTDEPLRVSLREHDVKPRDIAGAFLKGALEKVGKKIDDSVQVSVAIDAAEAL